MESTHGSFPIPLGDDGVTAVRGVNGAALTSFTNVRRPTRIGAPAIPLRTVTRVGADGAPVIEVHGELDIVTAGPLREVIESVAETRCAIITVDLAGVPFCDLVGLEELVKAADGLAARCGRLTLANPPSSLRRLLQVTGLSRRFHRIIDAGTD